MAQGRRKKITSEQKWMAVAIQLDKAHQERNEFRGKAVEAALNWATMSKEEFAGPGVRSDVLQMISSCKDKFNRDILADSFREAAEACDEERSGLMRRIADRISSGEQLKVEHFLNGFASA